MASIFLGLAAIGFMVSGMGLFFRQPWWRPVVVGSATPSTVLFILFWDGKFQALDEKGAVALLINLAILVPVLLLSRPY